MLSARAGSLAPTARPSWYSKYVPDSSCVLWLSGQDDAYSSTIRDRSGYGNDGTITGATWVRLSSGVWALSFDGTDDCALTPSLPYSATTLSCFWWQKSEFTAGIDTSVYFNGSNYITWVATGTTSQGILMQLVTGGYKDLQFSASSIYNKWAFCGFTFDNGIIKQYANGELVRTDDYSPDTISVSTLRIGGRSGAYYFEGLISETKVFDSILTAEQIRGTYQQTRHLYGK